MQEPSLGTLAAFVAGFLRASVGGGIGLALTPVLSLALPAQSALGLTGFMLNLADPIILRYYWRQWDARQLRLILPTALVSSCSCARGSTWDTTGAWAVRSAC